jgi:hypothetical protein
MNVRKIIAVALLTLSLPAAADFVIVSEAYEIALSDFRVPATPSSGAQFKQCEECDYQTVRVTPGTQYVVNGKAVTLKEFRKRVFDIRDRTAATVIVLHHLESDVIESVSIVI